jgi:hypothetical protein
MRAPIRVVHVEFIGCGGDIGGVDTAVLKAFFFSSTPAAHNGPHKNENDADNKEDITTV